MNNNDEPTLDELHTRLILYNARCKELVRERDEIIQHIMETEFQIFNKKYRIDKGKKAVKFM